MKKKSAFSLIELSIVILVIGILITGVAQSSKLVREFKLSTARQFTKGSPIPTIPDMAFWLDSLAANTIATGTSAPYIKVDDPTNGTAIGSWNDANPSTTSAKYSFTQTTLINQPLYKLNQISGLPALSFDGTDCLSISNFLLGDIISSDGNNEITVFVMQKFTGTTTSNTSVWSWDNGLSDRFIIFAPWNNGILMDSGNYSNTRVSNASTLTNDFPSFYSVPEIITFRRSGTDARGWFNGALIGSQVAGSLFSTNLPKSLEISGCSSPFIGAIGEIIVFSRALTNEERLTVERYLGKKWGVKVS